MERLRLALLNVELAARDLPGHLYQVVGEPGLSLEALASLCPHVVLVGFQNAQDAERRASQVMQRMPGAILLLIGAPLAPEDMVTLMRIGARDVVVPGVAVTNALKLAYRRYPFSQPAQAETPPAPPGRLIVVHSPKGGSGKSVLAANLAMSLQGSQEAGVVLVDLAMQGGDLDLLFDLKPTATWTDLAARPQLSGEDLEAALCDHASGLRLLAAPRLPEEGELIRMDLVASVLTRLRATNAWTVVDTGSTLSEVTFLAMELADHLLVPVPMSLPALRQVQRGLNLWPQLGIESGKVVLVAWDQGGELTPEAAEPVLGSAIRHRVPHDPRGVQASVNAGQPLVTLQPKGAYARSLHALMQELGTAPEALRVGVLQRLMSVGRWRHVSPQQA